MRYITNSHKTYIQKQSNKYLRSMHSPKALSIMDKETPTKRKIHTMNSPIEVCKKAREYLHVSREPDELPCRLDEFSSIYNQVLSALLEERGECVYISGVPGTGKTATVMRVMRALKKDADDAVIKQFDFVALNGMKLTDPNQAYVTLLREIKTGPGMAARRITTAHAQALLEKHFSAAGTRKKTDKMTVVLMDELDLLVTKKQTVMYNFFDWPNRPHSKLIVIAVANTMDLPERVLSNRVASRLGLARINFAPYTFQQLTEIVTSRLSGADAFEHDAVVFCARKVSSVTGDARRALDICRRATELLQEQLVSSEKENKPKTRGRPSAASKSKRVTLELVSRAIREMNSTPATLTIQNSAKAQKVFLWALVRSIRRGGVGETTLKSVFGELHTPLFQNLLNKLAARAPLNSGWVPPVFSLVLQPRKGVENGTVPKVYLSSVSVKSYLQFWASSRIILATAADEDLDIRIRLNINEEDIIMAIRSSHDDEVSKLILASS